MASITDDQLPDLLVMLAEAGRATEETAARFVPPRAGILEEASAKRHQLVFGRRGVGKSTLLKKVAAQGPESGRQVIFIDVETLRSRPYPDVLIELLIVLLHDLNERLSAGSPWKRFSRRRLRGGVQDLSEAMGLLLDEPQVAEHTVRALRSQSQHRARSANAGAAARFDVNAVRAAASADARARASNSSNRTEEEEATVEAKFERTKMDGLNEATILIRGVLDNALSELKHPTLLVLDDFYHIPLNDQPEVLAYLHQVVKGLDIYLKVCGVRHRLKPFSDGNPPVGLQPGHDASTISLDITLERFAAAKGFLERVLSGVCAPAGVDIEDLLTDGGRERLVLGSGGVARDYLSLTQRALRHSNERASNQSRPHNRITAEDVNQAAAELYGEKQEELRHDAGEESEALRNRLSDVVRVCVEQRSTNVFLVEVTKLQEEQWGKEIQALTDLRFFYRIGTLSTKRGGETYPGRKFAAFTLDLSVWTGARSEQIRPIRFWEPEGGQQIREPNLIYIPASGVASGAPTTAAAPLIAEYEQLVFDLDEPDEEDDAA